MDVASVSALVERYPGLPVVLTHLGDDVDRDDLPGVTFVEDFETISL
jgi:hypothetical protein